MSLFALPAFIQATPIHLGIDVLEQSGFRAVNGKRVGLASQIKDQTAHVRVRRNSLRAPSIRVA